MFFGTSKKTQQLNDDNFYNSDAQTSNVFEFDVYAVTNDESDLFKNRDAIVEKNHVEIEIT